MMASSVELFCYNKGCGKKFKEEENTDDVCAHHPGVPVFHDALKGWSCCKKRSTDFTDFLNIPGCTRSRHNPDKPVEPIKNPVKPLEKGEVIEVKAPPPPKPKLPTERPAEDESHVGLKVTVANSLKTALARHRKAQEEKQLTVAPTTTDNTQAETEEVPIGTQCKHNGCQTVYNGSSSNLSDCEFHPGIPIFHEGYKLWSCCRHRTSDFNEFLKQEGCKIGNHVWTEEANTRTTRYDWHQTGSQVVISVFSKCSVPEECHFTANSTSVNALITYEGGKKVFQKIFTLEGVIEPAKSSVELLGTKAEIKLRKMDGVPWKFLELKVASTKPAESNDKSETPTE